MWLTRLLRTEPTQPPVPLTFDGWLVFDAAICAARNNRSECLSSEHVLVGIVDSGATPAMEALECAGITPDDVYRWYERFATTPALWPMDGPLPLTPVMRRIFAAAWKEAELAGADGVGSLDLLVAATRAEWSTFQMCLLALLEDSKQVRGNRRT